MATREISQRPLGQETHGTGETKQLEIRGMLRTQEMDAKTETAAAKSAVTHEIYAIDETARLVEKIVGSLNRGDRVALLVFGKKLDRKGSTNEETAKSDEGRQVVAGLAQLYEEIEARGGNMNNLEVVLSGGHFHRYVLSGNSKNMTTEAVLMKRYLHELGVDPKNLVLEKKSYDTVTNILFSKPLIEKFGAKTVVVVSEEFMAQRAMETTERIMGNEISIYVKPVKLEINQAVKAYYMFKEWFVRRMVPILIATRRRENNMHEQKRRMQAVA